MPTALIAEDEPLLAQALRDELRRAWPALEVLRVVGDGTSAIHAALELAPQVLFLDIRMPGMSGLDAAIELADQWPPAHAPQQPFPALVFVTAYDEYAVQAFDAQAVDYLLKPVQTARLQKTVQKLQRNVLDASPTVQASHTVEAMAAGASAGGNTALDTALHQLRGLLAAQAPHQHTAAPLQVLQVGFAGQIRMVPIGDVLYFDAADKYVRVLTEGHEYLLRTALKDLLTQLDPGVFWQIHRGTVVRATAIHSVTRDDTGRMSLTLHNRPETLAISRLYAPRFKAM
ncbi:MAG: LytTR family DNA-binding domain-containing protein [Rhodoferax sp.]|nr:LytTR family DNA-binding domain-containing protein [Rhodoferax sp.]